LEACVEDPAGATLYVTLEPCCHTGKQPPCTEAVVAAGIARVVVGSRDPNPLVAGKGNAALRAAGIEVAEDVLRSRCDALNPVFFHFIQTGRPYVVSKWAMTLDGKIATRTGDGCWVSCEESRADTHRLRHRLASIMVGIGTVLADDPMLTARCDFPTRQPLRIVVDSTLRIPLESRLVKTAGEVPVLVATAVPAVDERAAALRDAGVELVSLPAPDGKVDLAALLHLLGTRGIDSVLVEGGATLHEAMFRTGLVNRTIVYLAPKVCGGIGAVTPVAGIGVERMADAFELGHPMVERIGDDLKISYLAKDAASEGGL
jgi:diaminohydroxyphosphoribosylaminopyrimidine deaminase/5-amino-6-(5-phosphoribosylamino)uracil reductase